MGGECVFWVGRREQEEEPDEALDQSQERLEKELDEGFWEELFSEGFEGELDTNPTNSQDQDEEEEDHVNVLANRFGYLGSSPKWNQPHIVLKIIIG